MEKTTMTVQETLDNFSAEIENGNVKLIAHNGEYSLYQDAGGIEYISDGGDTYSEFADGFAEIKAAQFGS